MCFSFCIFCQKMLKSVSLRSIIFLFYITQLKEEEQMALTKEQEEVIEQLYREMWTKLYIYAVNALKDHHIAEEAVQDTFRIACNSPDKLMSSGNKEGWLMQTLKYEIKNIRRSQASLNKLIVSAISTNTSEFVEGHGDDIFNVTYSDLLKEDDFKLLTMISVHKYTLIEAAEEFNISLEACKKRVQRAKKKYEKFFK